MRSLPEWIRRDLARIAVLGHHVDDGQAERPHGGEERGGALDHGPAAVGRERQRGHRRVEMAAVHVDGDDGRGSGIEPEHGGRPRRLIA